MFLSYCHGSFVTRLSLSSKRAPPISRPFTSCPLRHKRLRVKFVTNSDVDAGVQQSSIEASTTIDTDAIEQQSTDVSLPSPVGYLLPMVLSGVCAALAILSHLGYVAIPAPLSYLLGGVLAMICCAAASAVSAVRALQSRIGGTQSRFKEAFVAAKEKLQYAEAQLAQEQARSEEAALKLVAAQQEAEQKLAARLHAFERTLAAQQQEAEEKLVAERQVVEHKLAVRENELRVAEEKLECAELALGDAFMMRASAVDALEAAQKLADTAQVQALEASKKLAAVEQQMAATNEDNQRLVEEVQRMSKDVQKLDAPAVLHQEAAKSDPALMKAEADREDLLRELELNRQQLARVPELKAELNLAISSHNQAEGRLQEAQKAAERVMELEAQLSEALKGRKEAEEKLLAAQKPQPKRSPNAVEQSMAAELASLRSQMATEGRQRAMDLKEMSLLKNVTDEATAELKLVKRDTVAREREILALRKALTSVDPTRLFEGRRNHGAPTSHLQVYIDHVLSGSNITHAAVLSSETGIWAASPNFPATSQQDVKALLAGFDGGNELGALFRLKSKQVQVTFAGGRYSMERSDGRKELLVGKGVDKSGRDGGLVLRRGRNVIVAAAFEGKGSDRACVDRVVELGEYIDSLTVEAVVGGR